MPLLHNLRASPASESMIQIGTQDDRASLYRELREHVARVGERARLSVRDRELSTHLVNVLSKLDRVSVSAAVSEAHTRQASASSSSEYPPTDIYASLCRHVSDFQVLLSSPQTSAAVTRQPPIEAVEQALLWTSIGDDLDNVLQLCQERPESYHSDYTHLEHLPPGYEDDEEFDEEHELPSYSYAPYSSAEYQKSMEKRQGSIASDATLTNGSLGEKARLDLDGVARAIERFYSAVPQLSDQRVDPASIRLSGTTSDTSDKGKQREKEMVDLILKSTERRLHSQVYVPPRPEVREREREKERAMFVERLVERTGVGRLDGQDAQLTSAIALRRTRTETEDGERDPEEMISLPEFMKEPMPPTAQRSPTPRSRSRASSRPSSSGKDKEPSTKLKKGRNRSLSAPGLGWFRTSSPREGSEKSKLNGEITETDADTTHEDRLDVQYVAEHQESLGSISILLRIYGISLSKNTRLEAEVFSPSALQLGNVPVPDFLLIRKVPSQPSSPSASSGTSTPLIIPARAECGVYPLNFIPMPSPSKDAKGTEFEHQDEGYWELKLRAMNGKAGMQYEKEEPAGLNTVPTLLAASELERLRASSLVCGSCSLPLVRLVSIPTPATQGSEQGSSMPPVQYLDLPSEHWAELVDSWLCHSDQKLVLPGGSGSEGGMWPKLDQVLVGVSYVLVHEGRVVRSNLGGKGMAGLNGVGTHGATAQEWETVRCLCGAVIGKSMHAPENDDDHDANAEESSPVYYRFAKYAVRPASGSRREKLNLSIAAFFVEDMHAIAQAHATWRFVVCDDEEGRARFLIWLFKPSIRIAWSTARYRALEPRGNQLSAKVLFKVLDKGGVAVTPGEAGPLDEILAKYPGFNRAEYLSYPRDGCRRLMALLRESNRVYPSAMRTMTELEVGWLQRAPPCS